MPAIAVIGAQWGDEGKGKIVDLLAERVSIVVRFSGGDNAGHTVVNPQGEFKLHIIPSGIFYPHTTCIIGNGTVVNPAILLDEIEQLSGRGVDTSRLIISDRAHLIMPYHTLLDGLEEDKRGSGALGTTRRGIGPAFTDKAARLGIRTGDLLDKKTFRERLRTVLEYKNAILTKVYDSQPLSPDEIYQQYCRYGEQLAPYVRETTTILDEALRRGEQVLLEGAQGAMLDPDFGTYPYITSSSPLAGGASVGAGLGPTHITHVLAVFKAYCSRVGGGPMPTELKDDTGESIRQKGHEYGTTTGRARRCGWFDGVAARLATRINGFTKAAITRLDVLDHLPKVKLCVAYSLDGKEIDYFPSSISDLARCQPLYEEFPGWQTCTNDIRKIEQLPAEARQYLKRLEELINCPISIVSVGQKRGQTIEVKPVIKRSSGTANLPDPEHPSH
ncbi:MAG: adenylosuccinate synthase [Chloroflexi bacterium]|nr:adenylosuccinate synthase [Chloroflexota bacterium]